ncbi:MAG: metallophosphoesterase [Propionibacteriaceae bacterium]|nr:metallophosphoesterase [Propionibacteriaceae bacterium]
MKTSTLMGSLLATTGLIGAACVTYGTAFENRAYQLRHVTVPTLPPGHESIRILHLSDLHLLAGQTKKIAWVRALGYLRPHLLVNTGDNIASPTALETLVHTLSPLMKVPAVFVLGSNDVYYPRPLNPLKYFTNRDHDDVAPTLPTETLIRTLEDMGWTNAERQRLVFPINDSTIEVRGCGDAHMDIDDYDTVMGEPSTADLLIGVTHAPYRRVLDQMVADGAGLICTGHTHGGQVCLPSGRALTTNCDLPLEQAKGLSTHRLGQSSAYLHVSAGLGTSPFAPYRFFCPPEATLLTLTARPSEAHD